MKTVFKVFWVLAVQMFFFFWRVSADVVVGIGKYTTVICVGSAFILREREICKG